MKYIGVDLGGTNISAGIVEEDGSLHYQDSVPTGKGGSNEIAERIAGLVDKILENAELTIRDIQAIGIGVPGTANQERGLVEYANNLGMEDEPFLDILKPYFPQYLFRQVKNMWNTL